MKSVLGASFSVADADRNFRFFSEFSGCIGTGRKFEFLIIRDANQGACESDAFADSRMIRLTASRRRRRKQDSPTPTARR